MSDEMVGIMINLISKEKLNEMSPKERISFIVEEVKKGNVLVLERGLTAIEEMELIKVTMANIDHQSFVGVETPGFSLSAKKRSFWDRITRRKPPPRMMVVGPANLLKTIRKDGEVVKAMLLAKGGLRPMRKEEVEGKEDIKAPDGKEDVEMESPELPDSNELLDESTEDEEEPATEEEMYDDEAEVGGNEPEENEGDTEVQEKVEEKGLIDEEDNLDDRRSKDKEDGVDSDV